MEVPQTIGGRYRVIGELARGGMGVLYLAEHSGTGKRHAVKVLLGHLSFRPDALERFRREARAAARIDSPHVVQVTDADVAPELGGAPYLVMELLEGRDLAQHLASRGTLAAIEVVGILEQAGHAIERAHAAGIVHRDLKPNNLFLHRQSDGSTMVKVLDYGIAKSVAGLSDDVSVTGTGAVLGTPTYMAPEQARGGRVPIGPAADIWALGIIAYELLVGRSYWPELSTGEIIAELIEARIPLPSTRARGLPFGFDPWFARSCAADPAARFGAVGEQIAELGRALGVAQPVGAAVVIGPPPATPVTAPAIGSPQPGPVVSPEAYTPTVAAQLTAGGTPAPLPGAYPSTTGPLVQSHQIGRLAAPARPSRWPMVVALIAVALAAVAGTLWVTQRQDADDRRAGEDRKRRKGDRRDDQILDPEAADEPDLDLDLSDLGLPDLEDIVLPQNKRPAMPSGPGPHVVTGHVMVTGMDHAAAVATVEASYSDIRGCYQRVLARAPRLEGRLSPMLTIDSMGKQNSGGMVYAIGGIADPSLKSCVTGVLQRLTFPKPEAEVASVMVTFWMAP